MCPFLSNLFRIIFVSLPGGPCRCSGMNANMSLCPRLAKNSIHISIPFAEKVPPPPCLKINTQLQNQKYTYIITYKQLKSVEHFKNKYNIIFI